MKKHLILIAVLFAVFNGITQNRAVVSKELRNKILKNKPAISETKNLKPEAKESINPKEIDAFLIGNTFYDLQSNYSVQNRIYMHDDGKIGAVWTLGIDYPGFTDRGTGYNYFDGINWGPWPINRIESVRTGWPSYTPFGENGEMVVSHNFNSGSLLFLTREEKGTGTWNEEEFFGPSGTDISWNRSITSGINNNIIHTLALTWPLANGGSIYQGLDGAVLYSKSTNGGQSWEQENVILEGMTAGEYSGFGPDVFEWATNGDQIAFLVGSQWLDMFLMKSTDNGDTWTKTVIWDHPYPLWDPNNQFLTDTFYCVDGSHTIAFDNTGKIHIAFGINRAYSDGNTQHWFPLVDGVGYWNEDMSTFSNDMNALSPYGDPGSELIEDYNLIGWMQDVNGNGILDILGEPGTYYGGTSSMPQLVIDEQNNVFLIYSSVTETYYSSWQDYRHIWARGSDDNGQTWGDFVDLNYDLIYTFSECVFPSCSPTTDGYIHLVYQWDQEPGLAVRGDFDPYSENIIEYLKIPKADLIYVPNLGSLTGTVTKLNGGTPISGATIVVEGTSYSTTSNYNGSYNITNIPVGTYTVNCSKSGFYNQIYAIVIYEDQASTLNFQLTEIVIPGDQVIGHTWYDNQSNASMQNRIYMYPDGYIGTTFMYGILEPGFEDRGSGYNRFDGSNWGPIPNQRIEPERAGWPSYTPCGPNGEMVVAHYSGGSQTGPLAISKRITKGIGEWVTTAFSPPSGASGLLWSRVISGGENFNSIHMIALTTPVSNGGYIYQGQDGALLYSRSINGGESWDLQNMIISEIDNSFYNSIGSDSYEFAEPKGNSIAMLIGDDWHDLIVLKSEDNGSSWNKTIVWEHPYPFWNGEETELFYCPDGAHSIAMDNTGKVHIAFGITKTQSDEGGNTYMYSEVGGIGYWNEDMPVFSNDFFALSPYGDPGTELIQNYNFIGWEQDVNNNGSWDILGNLGTYYLGSSSMPQLVIDEINNIFLVFSSVTETFNNGTQDYRHIWARGSGDNGLTWGNFVDVTTEFTTSECVFPSCSPSSNDYLHLIFMEDNEPGLAVKGDYDPYVENDIEYLKINKSVLISSFPTGTLEGVVTSIATGNPIPGAIVHLVNATLTTSTTTNGHYTIANIPPGIYIVECSAEGFFTSTTEVSIVENNTTVQDFQLALGYLYPPGDLIGNMIGNDVLLQWQSPGSGFGQWIQWDAGVNGDAVGLTTGGTFFVASHWEQNDLLPYDGMELSKIAFFPSSDPNASFNLYVWTGPDATNQVLSQPIENFIIDEWNEVTLISPVLIDATEELWFGYSATHDQGLWPAGCDEGPAIQGKGDMISTGGTWSSLYVLTSGSIDANWNLAGYVEATDNKEPAKPMVKTIVQPSNSSFSLTNGPDNYANGSKKFSPEESKDLIGYNIYKNDVVIGNTENTYFLDENIEPGSYEYYITAIYDEGESEPSNSIWIIGPEPCNPPINIIAQTGSQNSVVVNWEQPPIGTPVGYNIYRDYTFIDYTTSLTFTDPYPGAGTYIYCVSAVCADGESELACADPVTVIYLAPPTNFFIYYDEFMIFLEWNPPAKKDLIGYNIYHSFNNGAFELYAFITWTAWIYEFVEIGLHSFYITAQYDEGESQSTETLSILITSMDDHLEQGLVVFPNPVKDEVTVSSDMIIKSVDIYNSFGEFITNIKVNDKTIHLNTSTLIQGIYYLKIDLGDALTTKKIIIE